MNHTIFTVIYDPMSGAPLNTLVTEHQGLEPTVERLGERTRSSRNGGRRPGNRHVKRVATKKRNQARHRAAVRRAKA